MYRFIVFDHLLQISHFTSWTALVIHSILTVNWYCCAVNVIMTFKLLACSFITFYPFNDYNCLLRWCIDIGRAPTGCVLLHCVTLSVNRQQKSPFDLMMKQEFSLALRKPNRLSFCTVCGPGVQSTRWFVKKNICSTLTANEYWSQGFHTKWINIILWLYC